MSDDRSNSMSRLASREREKSTKSDSELEPEPEPASSAQEPETVTEGSQSATDAEEAGHPNVDTSNSESAESATETNPVSVKNRGSNLFMYLPQSLGNEVDLACQSVNLTYQREHGEKLGKNRYLYPIILLVGTDAALELSADEIADLVEKVDEIEDGS